MHARGVAAAAAGGAAVAADVAKAPVLLLDQDDIQPGRKSTVSHTSRALFSAVHPLATAAQTLPAGPVCVTLLRGSEATWEPW